MLPPKMINTNRLTLRVPELSDADFMFNQYCRDSDVLKYLTFSPHKNIDDTKQVVSNMQKQWEDGKNANYAMCLTCEYRVLPFKIAVLRLSWQFPL